MHSGGSLVAEEEAVRTTAVGMHVLLRERSLQDHTKLVVRRNDVTCPRDVVAQDGAQFLGIADNEANGVVELGIVGNEPLRLTAELEAHGRQSHVHYSQYVRPPAQSPSRWCRIPRRLFAFPPRDVGKHGLRNVPLDLVLAHFGGLVLRGNTFCFLFQRQGNSTWCCTCWSPNE